MNAGLPHAMLPLSTSVNHKVLKPQPMVCMTVQAEISLQYPREV